MADRAKAVQESYEDRQESTSEALDELLALIKANEERKRIQAEKGLDDIAYFIMDTLTEAGIRDPEDVARAAGQAFVDNPNWKTSQRDLRAARLAVTGAVRRAFYDERKAAGVVQKIFATLTRKSPND